MNCGIHTQKFGKSNQFLFRKTAEVTLFVVDMYNRYALAVKTENLIENIP